MVKPINVYVIPPGPNPWKVIIILEELGIPYELKMLGYAEVKSEPFVSINPNGRVPAIEDPNTGITIWESGAIVEYLVDQYDKEEKISYSSFPEKYHLKQWLHFQMSGQGPYFGQAAWFNQFHPEKIPSAQERYEAEVKRVVGTVFENALKGKDWLVGDKCTYADLSFFMWNNNIGMIFGGRSPDWTVDDYPNFKKWHDSMASRESVKKALAARDKALAGMQHG